MPEATILPVSSSAQTGCRLLQCIWHERGQPINKHKSYRIPGSVHPERHTDRPWGVELCAGAFRWCHTRGREYYCSSAFLLAAFCSFYRLPQRFEPDRKYYCCEWSLGGHAIFEKVKVDRSDAYLKNKCKMHLAQHLYLKRQLLHRRTAVTESATKRQL